MNNTTPWPGETTENTNKGSGARRHAMVLSIALLVSFGFCVASDLGFSAALRQAGITLPPTTKLLALGITWLLGHSLHGAGVVALPLFILTRSTSLFGESE